MAKMDISVLVEIAKWVIPIAIAVASLLYAAKQRNSVKKDISKKRYIENALSNLNETIKSLKTINVPEISNLSYDLQDSWGDDYRDTYMLVCEILRASFELKRRKIVADVSYSMRVASKSESDQKEKERTIKNFDELGQKRFADHLRSNKDYWSIESETEIPDFERNIGNEVRFGTLEFEIGALRQALEQLSSFEEVYETVSPNTIMKANQLFEEITEAIFRVIEKPKKIEIDLDKLSKTDEIVKYLYEGILNYTNIAEKFSKVSELISELVEARKELFLKIY